MTDMIQTPAANVAPITAPATAPKAPAKVNGKAPAKAGAKAPAKGKATVPAAPVKRSSRVEPIQAKVLAALGKTTAKDGLSVAAMAKQFACTEREVRLAIDRARNMGFKGELLRTVKGFFALTAKGKKDAAKVAAKA